MAAEHDLKLPGKAFYAIWLPLARLIGAVLLFFLGPVRAMGRERIPKTGGLLVLSNHIADVDPPVVQYGCPRHIFFMAKSELFTMKVIGPLMRFFGAFPVKRGEPDRESIRHAVELLKAGQVVGIFPEGQLSEDGKLQELKPGVALIVRMAQCQVICCGLTNTDRILPYGKVIPRPALRSVTVSWSEPRSFDKSATTDEIMNWADQQLRSLTCQERLGATPDAC